MLCCCQRNPYLHPLIPYQPITSLINNTTPISLYHAKSQFVTCQSSRYIIAIVSLLLTSARACSTHIKPTQTRNLRLVSGSLVPIRDINNQPGVFRMCRRAGSSQRCRDVHIYQADPPVCHLLLYLCFLPFGTELLDCARLYNGNGRPLTHA